MSSLATWSVQELQYDPAEDAEALRRGLFADGNPEQAESVRAIRIGKRLGRMTEERLYKTAWGLPSMERFIAEAQRRGDLPYGWAQAKKYRRTGVLQLEHFQGTSFPLTLLLELAKR